MHWANKPLWWQGLAGMYKQGRFWRSVCRVLRSVAQGRAGMVYKGCSNRDGFDAVFAGFCAVLRRGEQGWS